MGRFRGEIWRDRRVFGLLIAIVVALAIMPRLRLDEPPRYDGAGYATLARALASGAGYRDISDPDRPPHTHFPPGYPLALALIFRVSGESTRLAHGFSVCCTLFAVWAFWRGWLRTETRPVADLLGLGLAVNWTWIRNGGAIQSEPMFAALTGLTLLLASRPSGRGGIGRSALVGALLGLCILTRHVGVCLAIAVGLDLWYQGRRRATLVMLAVASAVVGPWAVWLAGAGRGTQAGLFRPASLAGLVIDQVVFYARRIPDQIVGPFVEVATVFGRSPIAASVASVATAFGFVFSTIVVLGWVLMVGEPRRRLGGLVPLATLPLLLAWPFTEAGRFLVPLVPFLLQGAFEGLDWIVRVIGRGRSSRAAAAALLLAASIPYSAYSLITDREGARIATHAEFDAACRWIAGRADHPGPVMARHPADVAWLTGRLALSGEAGEIEREIRAHGIAFVLVDDARFANAPAGVLGRFAEQSPALRLVYGRDRPIRVYEVVADMRSGQGVPPPG